MGPTGNVHPWHKTRPAWSESSLSQWPIQGRKPQTAKSARCATGFASFLECGDRLPSHNIGKQISHTSCRSATGQRGFGIAAHRSFLTYVAIVAEVEADKSGQVRIPPVDLAVHAWTVIHPERVRAQFERAAAFRTSIAMLGEIAAKNGQIEQSNFHDYPAARIQEAPR